MKWPHHQMNVTHKSYQLFRETRVTKSSREFVLKSWKLQEWSCKIQFRSKIWILWVKMNAWVFLPYTNESFKLSQRSFLVETALVTDIRIYTIFAFFQPLVIHWRFFWYLFVWNGGFLKHKRKSSHSPQSFRRKAPSSALKSFICGSGFLIRGKTTYYIKCVFYLAEKPQHQIKPLSRMQIKVSKVFVHTFLF